MTAITAARPGPAFVAPCRNSIMHLMFTLAEDGTRVYTMKKITDAGKITKSAHPARFSPDDKFSRHRVTIKKRHNVLLTQQPSEPM